MAEQTLSFETEVSKLLNIVIHSLYSEKQIFLRELISNASDACDKLRYRALTEPELMGEDSDLAVTITVDDKKRTLTVADNGIGMNRDDMISELGTVARSGTAGFLDQLTGDSKKDMALIGQFGVGFYSAFMVADKVEVISRKAGEEQAWRWESTGESDYTVAEAERDGRGTSVILHLKKDASDFLDAERLKHVIRTYSDHIGLPVQLKTGEVAETVNAASALWRRPRNEISEDEYKEFYRHVGHAFDEPWLTLHNRAEGKLEYTSLLFVPTVRPFDLFDPQRRHGVKLYVKRVFITDECDELMPSWLRFVRGLVDSEDLPLNVSREMLQDNPVLARIRQALVKRVLGELEKKAAKAPEEYATFWSNFGAVLKEGLYEDPAHRDALLKVVRFHSTAGDGLVSLDDYVGRMKEGQEAIYTISGESLEMLRKSPQLEGFAARGVEVLLLTDPIDEFWVPAVAAYQEKPIKSATRAGADLDKIARTDDGKADEPAPEADALIAMIKLALKDEVKDVRVSERLTESPVCLVSDAGDIDIRLERMLKASGREGFETKRILEINPRHVLLRSLADHVGKGGESADLEDAARLLYDQALILEGEPVPDPAAFSRRMTAMMEKGLNS